MRFATPWLPLDVAKAAPPKIGVPSFALPTSLSSDSPRLHEARATFEPPASINARAGDSRRGGRVGDWLQVQAVSVVARS